MTTMIRGLILCIAVLAGGTSAMAQGTNVPFGGLEHDSTLPVEIGADQLQVNQSDGSATFTGNVAIAQGDMRLSGDKVMVEYAAAGGDPTGRIQRLLATGNVVLVSGDEAAEAASAEYTIDTGSIVLRGGVILTQGRNALTADSMVVDLTTGNATLQGRVRSIFQPDAN